ASILADATMDIAVFTGRTVKGPGKAHEPPIGRFADAKIPIEDAVCRIVGRGDRLGPVLALILGKQQNRPLVPIAGIAIALVGLDAHGETTIGEPEQWGSQARRPDLLRQVDVPPVTPTL